MLYQLSYTPALVRLREVDGTSELRKWDRIGKGAAAKVEKVSTLKTHPTNAKSHPAPPASASAERFFIRK